MDQTLQEQVVGISDEDRDSLTTLPLVMIPLETQALKQTKMVKNSNLESVIELFSDSDTGKGHVSPDDLKQVFSTITAGDLEVIHNLAELQSYDVYSLRITLRQNGIEIDNYEDLKLSDEKQAELQSYMQPFMEQLVVSIYGPDHAESGGPIDWLSLFHHPDIKNTRKHLLNMAGKMDIPLHEVPRFIQEYGDAYLSVAYYRECLDNIRPAMRDFLQSTNEIMNHQQLRGNYSLIKTCGRLKTKVEKIATVLVNQFNFFGDTNAQMWGDMSPESFQEFREAVHKNHSQMGGLLCALTVKMNTWVDKFPDPEDGGPMRRADFIVTDMGRGW